MIDHLFIPLLGLFIIALLLGYSTGYLPTRMRWYYERWRWRRLQSKMLRTLGRDYCGHHPCPDGEELDAFIERRGEARNASL